MKVKSFTVSALVPLSFGRTYASFGSLSPATNLIERLRLIKDAAEIASRELESFSYSVAPDLRAPRRPRA